MRIALELSDNQIALLQGAALALPMLIIGVPLGLAVDRYSRVRLLFVSTVLLLIGSVLTAVASIFAILTLGSIMIWTAPTLTRVFALSPARIGAIMALAIPLGSISGIIVGGFLADLCQRSGGPSRTITVGIALALLSAPLGLFPIMPSVTSVSILLVLSMAMLTTICTITSTLVVNVIPNEIRGLYGGVSDGITAFLSVTFGPLLVSLLVGFLGGPALIGQSLAWVCVTASVLCAVSFALGRRYLKGATVH